MKKITSLILVLFTISNYGQSIQTNTTAEYNERTSTLNNVTRINLFDIDYNGDKIPVILSYAHDGIKVNEKQSSSLGIKWKIENIGYINRTINYLSDNNPTKGWFNSLDPDFSSNTAGLPYSLSENDLSPDFFSASICNRDGFDFFFKKNITGNVIGKPVPEFLSNPDGYKINTNFNNFNSSDGAVISTGTVFNIKDKWGNNYDFINGPNLYDHLRAFQDTFHNNYFLKSITNPNNSDFINIDYITVGGLLEDNYYAVGYSFVTSNTFFACTISPQEYQNNIMIRSGSDSYIIDKTRFDLKKITSNKIVVDFIYTANNENLDEINISDLNGNYISGYKFEYMNFGTSNNIYSNNDIPRTLYKIKKYDKTHGQAQTIYEFEYNSSGGYDHFGTDGTFWTEQYQDHFGYFNNVQKNNMLPFDLKDYYSYNNCNVIPAGDFEPDLGWCKAYSLYRIKNKYSGTIEFDYQLNQGVHDLWGSLYGGGLIISSKKETPLTGKSILRTYNYHNLNGFIIEQGNFAQQYMEEVQTGIKFFSSIPVLRQIFDSPIGEGTNYYTIHKAGNFFNTVTESLYDADDMSLKSSIIREYVTNTEGIYRTPLLKKETYKNALNQDVKQTVYNYDYQNIETINSAEFVVQQRNGGYFVSKKKTNRPIFVNRNNLAGKLETLWSNGNAITNTDSYTYINPNTKLLRSRTRLSTLGETIEERYYYPQDTEMSAESLASALVTNNIIGTPLKTEVYRASEKLSEQKTVYAKDATTGNFLLPKYVYAKKGNDTNSTLEKKVTYDKYDTNGVLLQYTPESGTPTSIIWGYNKTQPIAKIENVAFASISAATITNLQAKSNADISSTDTTNEQALRTASNALRTTFPNAMITTYTYDPLIGITSTTDYKGYTVYYSYDTFGRLQYVKDKDGNLLSENTYNYKQ